MATWAKHLIDFYGTLQPVKNLPNDIEWLHPQQSGEVMQIVEKFLLKFYNDEKPRTILLGINPGRFGAGLTGVNFTASKQLTQFCKIENDLKQQTELSAEFIYEVIERYGGAEKFYHDFFIGSVSPLGFVQRGKNINYYDDKALQKAVEPFIVQNIKKLLSFNARRDVCLCIGGEKNFKYLSALNEQHHFFNEIVPLPHPRFILQYRRKQKEEYVQLYLDALQKAHNR
jgi:hypothetical protein